MYSAPFHFWIIDVYFGSPLFVLTFFVALPTIIIFNLLIKFIIIFLMFKNILYYILLFFSMCSLIIGSLVLYLNLV